ncbi:MAG TPA: 2OG-Fe(II) oxygenase [Burkholderiales bacterium]|nr:2OG-Fe(II) oxygenase [Burkholderiales bacterium]
MLRKDIDWQSLREAYAGAAPFPHVVIDDFFDPEVAGALEEDIAPADDPLWMEYSNPIEEKRALNHWDRFPPVTYRVLAYLNDEFVQPLRELTGLASLSSDVGLHGGGWHLHGRGGKLNVHLDYSIHPKLGLERRLNLIVYLTPGWDPAWGGALGLWSHNAGARAPGQMVKSVECVFNRAVIFDTTANSWHGLPDPITCPAGVYRKSIAVYYLTPPREDAAERGKALFAPHGEQKADREVLELIRRRSDTATAADTYRRK